MANESIKRPRDANQLKAWAAILSKAKEAAIAKKAAAHGGKN